MLNLFAQPEENRPDCTEEEVLVILGVTRQTLRNWRTGYGGTREPKLIKGRDWYRLQAHKTAPVMYSGRWVAGMEAINKIKEELK